LSEAPIPEFAIPSVQTTTIEPGAPSEAIATEVVTAGPRAVMLSAFKFIIFFYRTYTDSSIFRFILSEPYYFPFFKRNS
jgi:hypothetical protein